MLDAQNDNTGSDLLPLPLDRDTEQVFDTLAGLNLSDEERHRELVRRAVQDSARMRIGIGRSLQRAQRAIVRLDIEQAVIAADFDRARAPHEQRIADAERALATLAEMHRTAGMGNQMVVPGVGDWSTRLQPERWSVNNDQAMASLTADEKPRYTEKPPPKAQPVKLKGDEFRAHLDALAAEDTAALMEDPNFMGLPDDVRAELIAGVKTKVAGLYGGVQYVPPIIHVSYTLNGGE